jgi:hypothetical protein
MGCETRQRIITFNFYTNVIKRKKMDEDTMTIFYTDLLKNLFSNLKRNFIIIIIIIIIIITIISICFFLSFFFYFALLMCIFSSACL